MQMCAAETWVLGRRPPGGDLQVSSEHCTSVGQILGLPWLLSIAEFQHWVRLAWLLWSGDVGQGGGGRPF